MNLIKISTILIVSSFNSIFASCSQFKIPENLTDYILPLEENKFLDINGVPLLVKHQNDNNYDLKLTNDTLDIVNLSVITDYHRAYLNYILQNICFNHNTTNITITTSDKNWINNIKINPIKDGKYKRIGEDSSDEDKNKMLKYKYLLTMFIEYPPLLLYQFKGSYNFNKIISCTLGYADYFGYDLGTTFNQALVIKNNDNITFDISTIGDIKNFKNIVEDGTISGTSGSATGGVADDTTIGNNSQLSSISSSINELLKWHKEEIKLFHLWNHEIDKRVKKIKLREEELDKKEEKLKKIK